MARVMERRGRQEGLYDSLFTEYYCTPSSVVTLYPDPWMADEIV